MAQSYELSLFWAVRQAWGLHTTDRAAIYLVELPKYLVSDDRGRGGINTGRRYGAKRGGMATAAAAWHAAGRDRSRYGLHMAVGVYCLTKHGLATRQLDTLVNPIGY